MRKAERERGDLEVQGQGKRKSLSPARCRVGFKAGGKCSLRLVAATTTGEEG